MRGWDPMGEGQEGGVGGQGPPTSQDRHGLEKQGPVTHPWMLPSVPFMWQPHPHPHPPSLRA